MGTALVCDYQPSQPTGWQSSQGTFETTGVTIGGHTAADNFVHKGHSYRISLVSDPVYEKLPSERFTGKLGATFGDRYDFRYAGGLTGNGRFQVRSYSVAVVPANDKTPLLTYSYDFYVTYEGKPAGRAARFIHVFHTSGTVLGEKTELENGRRANPYALRGGSTSVNGRRVTNFYTDLAVTPADDEPDLTGGFTGEAFLAWDSGTKDSSGRGIVTVAGGIRYGWQVVGVAS